MCSFVSYWKQFGHAGLRDLLVEIGVVGSSAINGVISGKHYMRSLRVHKIAFEAVFKRAGNPSKSACLIACAKTHYKSVTCIVPRHNQGSSWEQ